MTFEEIKSLIQLINKSDLAEFIFQDGDKKIVIRTAKYQSGKPQIIQTSTPLAAPLAATSSVAFSPASTSVSEAAPSKTEEIPKSTPTTAPTAAPTEGGGDYLEIKSPIVGTFYRSAGPDKPTYAKVGDKVTKGMVVCIVEAMKLFNEIESDVEGKIVKVMVDDASPVEYDQVLFLVDPKG